jgi:hypothetical protein
MTETKWCKNIQLNVPLQRKRMSVTWDDFCVIRHIFRTFLQNVCLLSVSKDTKLSHSQNIYIDLNSFALWCSIDYILKLMKKMTDITTQHFVFNRFINFYISVFVYRAEINVKIESSKQIFFYVIVRIKIWTCLTCP